MFWHISTMFEIKNQQVGSPFLKNVENYDRGFYTGIFGIFDGKSLQSFVLIRFIEKIEDELFYKSGGGITLDSDLKLEYEELINKVYLPF